MTQIDNGTIQYRDEVVRKTIHLFSLSIPILYYYLTKQVALAILLPLTVLSIVLDIGRYFYPKLGNLFYFIFGFMLRSHEKDHKKRNLNGATYVLVSALVCVIILPKVCFLTAFSVLIVSDSSAALIGRKFGRHKFLFKSLEGTMAFFISACLVVFFTPKIALLPAEYMIGFFSVAVGAIAENVSYGWADDNLTIPLSIGLTMWILYAIFLPKLTLILPNAPI
ncbi:MAG: dolichol kinase [Ignavibacteria bacterium]|jgi:dolichol kinase|nr:dolichol kinase [Ignavibacteria bacterium]MCU7502811.1 dolichol kinase [Ignavibacteria bacterium]MCU7517909.1 dolichol kinase [Ignavibacteria bacterium]